LWEEKFTALYQKPVFCSLYAENTLYRIFMHQAVFSACILSRISKDTMVLLDDAYNFPLHLIDQLPESGRRELIDELVILRYEDMVDNGSWRKLSMSDDLRNWIENSLSLAGNPE
jgi:hypothetical protein